MTKLRAFVRLDFVTVKPYFTLKNLLIFAAVAVFLTATSGNLSSAMGVGMMIGTLFVGYPFALSEKSNMDALYATLSVDRKTVVRGRYIFTLLLNACAILFSLLLAAAGLLAARVFSFDAEAGASLAAVMALSALFLAIQSIQLPIYFRLGYTKAKFLSIVPFVALMSGYLVILSLGNAGGGPPAFIASLFSGGMAIPLLVAALLVVVLISYNLSLMFYNKREF